MCVRAAVLSRTHQRPTGPQKGWSRLAVGKRITRWDICVRSRAMNRTTSVVTLILAAAAMGGAMQGLASRAHAAPPPEVEYVYDVMVRRHYEPLALLAA